MGALDLGAASAVWYSKTAERALVQVAADGDEEAAAAGVAPKKRLLVETTHCPKADTLLHPAVGLGIILLYRQVQWWL